MGNLMSHELSIFWILKSYILQDKLDRKSRKVEKLIKRACRKAESIKNLEFGWEAKLLDNTSKLKARKYKT